MSNKRRLPRRPVPDDVRDTAAEARCSDCGGTGQARALRTGYEVKVIHQPSCPSFGGVTSGLHSDAAASVARASARTCRPMTYARISDEQGEVIGATGIVTTGR